MKQKWAGVLVALALLLAAGLQASPAQAAPASVSHTATVPADCPPGTQCQVITAALTDGGCNWSPANRPADLPIYGIHEHTTEGGLAAALAEAQDTANCVSWNYLVDQTGKIYVSVPPDSLAYDVGNWWLNTHYIEVEHIGYAEDCSTLTPAEYLASVKLDRYLIHRYHLSATPATITGHDSYTPVKDTSNAVRKQHWDPGVCWPWAAYLAAVGAPIMPTALPGSSVVTINTDNSHQPVQNCPGVDASNLPAFTGCVPAAQGTTNFVALHTQPSASSPLLSDPYLHTDGSPGTVAMQDWGDKAVTGHSYVVANRQGDWVQIWYGGKLGWFQNRGFTVPTAAQVVTPRGTDPVPVYGRPLPEPSAPGWAQIPYDQQTELAFTKYALQPGQYYVVAQVPTPRTDYAEGCNLADCSGPGDTTVVIGTTRYLQISWDHHYAFVKADDVSVSWRH